VEELPAVYTLCVVVCSQRVGVCGKKGCHVIIEKNFFCCSGFMQFIVPFYGW